MSSRFFKNKQKPGAAARSSKVITAVNGLIQKNTLKVNGSIFHVFRDILVGDKETIIKNLFFYARLKNIVEANGTIFIKDLESEELIAVYTSKSGTVFY